MVARNSEIQTHVRRLIDQLQELVGDLQPFRDDPAAAIASRLDFLVEFREQRFNQCGIAGSFHPEKRLIVVGLAMSAGRVRFTALHELAHALGHQDAIFQDWIFALEPQGRLAEERVANAFATQVLLPSSMVDAFIPVEGPSAWDVIQLWKKSLASREAVCVGAAQRLCYPGLVALVHGSTIQFAAGHSLLFQVSRDSDQGAGSFFDRATKNLTLRENDVELRLPENQFSGTFMADAYRDDDGYAFVVLQEHGAAWAPATTFVAEPVLYELECPLCDRTRVTPVRVCPKCGDHPCPDHGCSCKLAPWIDPKILHCEQCHIELPKAARPGTRFCDRHD